MTIKSTAGYAAARPRHDRSFRAEKSRRRTATVVSYGTSSYGYDIRARANSRSHNINTTSSIPGLRRARRRFPSDVCIVPQNSLALGGRRICRSRATCSRCACGKSSTPLRHHRDGRPRARVGRASRLEFSNTTRCGEDLRTGRAQLISRVRAEDVARRDRTAAASTQRQDRRALTKI